MPREPALWRALDWRKLVAWAAACAALGGLGHWAAAAWGRVAIVWLVAAALFATGAALLAMQVASRRSVRGLIRDSVGRAALKSLHAAALANAFESPLAPLPPLSSWSISLDLASHLCLLLRTRRPRRVLELGAGLSTLLIGKHFAGQGRGELVSLESDAGYFAVYRDVLTAHGLEERVRLIHAPLAACEVEGRPQTWYAGFDLGRETFDLLLVDGPSGQACARARWPALPRLRDHLADEALIVVDDYHRADERAMVADWRDRYREVRAVESLRLGRRDAALLHWRREA